MSRQPKGEGEAVEKAKGQRYSSTTSTMKVNRGNLWLGGSSEGGPTSANTAMAASTGEKPLSSGVSSPQTQY